MDLRPQHIRFNDEGNPIDDRPPFALVKRTFSETDTEEDEPRPFKKQKTSPSFSYMPRRTYRRAPVRRRRRATRRRPRVNVARALARNEYPRSKYPAGIYYDRVQKSYQPRMSEYTINTFGSSWQEANRTEKQARLAAGYRGAGDYSKYRRFGARLGNALAGGIRGWRDGGSRFRGFGDYSGDNGTVTTYGGPVDNQLIEGGNPPLSVNSSNDLTGDIIFNHTEFIGNITASSTGFENRTFPINPGLPGTFPFLSQIARNFTLYEFNGVIFEFRPTSGEFGSTSNALGKVIMATDYDPDAAPFTNSTQMENYDYASSSKPSLTARHGVETALNQSALRMSYIRTGNTSRDKIFTDIGQFQLATEGLPETGVVGELWVTYKVKLSRSQISGVSLPYSYAHYTASASNAAFFNDSDTEKYNNIGCTINADRTTLLFNKGQHQGRSYLVLFTMRKAANDVKNVVLCQFVGFDERDVLTSATTYGSAMVMPIEAEAGGTTGAWGTTIQDCGTAYTYRASETAEVLTMTPNSDGRTGTPIDMLIMEIPTDDVIPP